MALKIKQEKTAPELEYARSKLDIALQTIIDKTEESPISSDDESNRGFSDIAIKREPSPISSPAKKPTQRTQRKRRRKDETLNKNANSYVMKLFDRAVDLTPFTETTPLYPICRAWINNQSLYKAPISKEELKNEEPEICEETEKNSENQETEDVFQLPPPLPLPEGKDIRIPSPIPHEEEDFIICSDNIHEYPRDYLMTRHLMHWKQVRQKWKQAAKANEDRYKESGMILKSMFERAQCREDPLSSEQWDGLNSVS